MIPYQSDNTNEQGPYDAMSNWSAVTDVWSSMGHEGQEADRIATFTPYRVDEALLDLAAPEVLFMHCLPAHRGEEVSATLLDDPRAVVWQEAGNRLHSQKALMEWLLLGPPANA